MKNITVLLVCGSGASTGFMAANMRKAAKARGLEANVLARSEAEVENYADEADFILLGPHLDYLEDEIKERLEGSNAKTYVMNKSYYSTLNGEAAIDDLIRHMNE